MSQLAALSLVHGDQSHRRLPTAYACWALQGAGTRYNMMSEQGVTGPQGLTGPLQCSRLWASRTNVLRNTTVISDLLKPPQHSLRPVQDRTVPLGSVRGVSPYVRRPKAKSEAVIRCRDVELALRDLSTSSMKHPPLIKESASYTTLDMPSDIVIVPTGVLRTAPQPGDRRLPSPHQVQAIRLIALGCVRSRPCHLLPPQFPGRTGTCLESVQACVKSCKRGTHDQAMPSMSTCMRCIWVWRLEH